MRRRTPSEIKAYGDGYTEAYKEFCHLLKNHDVDKAMRKMKIFADAVVLTVETAKDEPQTEEWYTYQDEQEYNDRWQTDEPQTDDIGVPWTDCQTALDEPQTDCVWK